MATDPHRIPVKDAAALTLRWRQNQPKGSIKAARFDRAAFDRLLSQPNCAGIRIYHALHDQPDPKSGSAWTFVLIGTDADGNDIIPPDTPGAAESDGDPDQYPWTCPPFCSADSPLNTPP